MFLFTGDVMICASRAFPMAKKMIMKMINNNTEWNDAANVGRLITYQLH